MQNVSDFKHKYKTTTHFSGNELQKKFLPYSHVNKLFI
jgi:hypothetical protein